MITVTGTLYDPSGTAINGTTAKAVLTFVSQSTPLPITGGVVVNGTVTTTVGTDGTFSQALEPGTYQVNVSYTNKAYASNFLINVPSGSGSVTIDTLVTSITAYTYAAADVNFRIATGKGIQIYNPDTGLWHTLTITGAVPVLGIDAGN